MDVEPMFTPKVFVEQHLIHKMSFEEFYSLSSVNFPALWHKKLPRNNYIEQFGKSSILTLWCRLFKAC